MAHKQAGKQTSRRDVPIAIRAFGIDIDALIRDSVRRRLESKLGLLDVERVSVRFEDLNGPKGGVDIRCAIKVVLGGLTTVFVDERAATAPEAFDRSAARAVLAVRRSLARAHERAPAAGHRAQRGRSGELTGQSSARQRALLAERDPKTGRVHKRRALPAPDDGSLIGRRVGHAAENLARALDRPEKRRRDAVVDTALPGFSATDRRAGGGSTARRNTKKKTTRAVAALEDSVNDRPSRKSTRKSANRAKQAAPLRQRAISDASSPKARATRGR